MIPERKSSSNNEKVSTYVNTPFTPTISLGKKHGRTLSNTIGRHPRNENEGGWKLAIRRPGSGTVLGEKKKKNAYKEILIIFLGASTKYSCHKRLRYLS